MQCPQEPDRKRSKNENKNRKEKRDEDANDAQGKKHKKYKKNKKEKRDEDANDAQGKTHKKDKWGKKHKKDKGDKSHKRNKDDKVRTHNMKDAQESLDARIRHYQRLAEWSGVSNNMLNVRYEPRYKHGCIHFAVVGRLRKKGPKSTLTVRFEPGNHDEEFQAHAVPP